MDSLFEADKVGSLAVEANSVCNYVKNLYADLVWVRANEDLKKLMIQ